MKLLLSFSIISLSWSLVGAVTRSAGCGFSNEFATAGQCETRSITTTDGVERSARVCAPSKGFFSPDDPLPLVFNFHGNPSTANLQETYTEMHVTGEKFDFYTVYPQGLQYGSDPDNFAHNAGGCCGNATANDLQFTRDLLDDVGYWACIDLDKVFATGWSNGGYMAYYLACRASDMIKAIAPVGGLIGVDPWNNCSTEVPVLHFHEINDPDVDYCGKKTDEYTNAEDLVKEFALKQGCSADVGVSYQYNDMVCRSHKGCPSGKNATLCAVDKATHTWFDNWTSVSHTQGNEAIWDFFDSVTSDDSKLGACSNGSCDSNCPNLVTPPKSKGVLLAKPSRTLALCVSLLIFLS